MNPIETYLKEKKAGFFGDVGRGAAHYVTGGEGMKGFGEGLGRHLATGAMATGGVLAAGAAGACISKVYEAATKARDFKAMLAENQDVAAAHAENPRQINRYFSTLRTFNPDFSKDPLVAGNYMRKMLASPESAGGIVEQTLNYRDKLGPTLGERVTRAAGGGKGKQ